MANNNDTYTLLILLVSDCKDAIIINAKTKKFMFNRDCVCIKI